MPKIDAAAPEIDDDDVGEAANLAPPPTDDDGFVDWLREEVAKCPAWAEHAEILERCVQIAGRTWRERFGRDKKLWSRIRRGKRLIKELAESAPVLVRVLRAVEALELPDPSKKLVILDLCSGFGYLAMFLSELLAPFAHKVEKIVCVDIRWAPHSVELAAHHLNPEHLFAPGWPIRLTTSRADLKNTSARKQLARTFLAHGAPAMLLGIHLCGILSLRALDLFNDSPSLVELALAPCCLPDMVHAKRCEIFAVGKHRFRACEVCAHGRWSKNKWVGRSGREEVRLKFGKWAGHLHAGVDEAGPDNPPGGRKSLEHIRVQESWFQNEFIFCTRPFSPAPPRCLAVGGDGSISSAAAAAAASAKKSQAELRAEWKAQTEEARREAKMERRRAKFSAAQEERFQAGAAEAGLACETCEPEASPLRARVAVAALVVAVVAAAALRWRRV